MHFLNYNLTPLDMCNGIPKLIISNQKEEFISIQGFKTALITVFLANNGISAF